jgi:hypothetical protein
VVAFFFPPPLFGNVSARSFTFVGSCTSTSSSLDFSSLSAGAIAAGDLAVYIDHAAHNTTPTPVTPSGFTNNISDPEALGGGGDGDILGMVSVKKLDGTEGVVAGIATVGASLGKVGLVLRPSSAFTTITASTPTSQITASNPSTQAISPSAETTAVIVIGVSAINGGTAAFSTASPAFDATVANSDADLLVGYKIYAAGSAANHSIDMNDLGSGNWLAGIYYTVS